MSVVEESKRRAAYAAVDKHILPGHKVLRYSHYYICPGNTHPP